VIPELLKEIGQTEYDLIVSGFSPEEDRLSRYVMGDIAREILNRAELPVLAMRTPQRGIAARMSHLVGNLLHGAKGTAGGADS
jgi:hypothetical protein